MPRGFAPCSRSGVDRLRVTRRVEPLPEEIAATPFETVDAECPKCVEFLRTALEHALAHLDPRDRLRLGLYYAQQLTLAETGRLLKEHEATTSRQLARTRKTVRDEVEKKLRGGGLSDAEIARCFECASKDVRYDESGRDARTGSQAAQGIRRGSFYMKRESMAGEGERDLWLGPTLRHWPTAPSDRCVDAEALAAWVEGKLDAKQASAVELHTSDCPHCMGMLASMERATPVAEEPKRAWSTGTLLRWLVPLAAAAAAIAIWIALPNRPVTQVPSASVPEAKRAAAKPARIAPAAEREAGPVASDGQEPDVQAPTPVPEAGQAGSTRADQFAPVLPDERRGAIERQPPPGARENAERRAEAKEERQALDALGRRSLSTLRIGQRRRAIASSRAATIRSERAGQRNVCRSNASAAAGSCSRAVERIDGARAIRSSDGGSLPGRPSSGRSTAATRGLKHPPFLA